jgi:hypothetical protein
MPAPETAPKWTWIHARFASDEMDADELREFVAAAVVAADAKREAASVDVAALGVELEAIGDVIRAGKEHKADSIRQLAEEMYARGMAHFDCNTTDPPHYFLDRAKFLVATFAKELAAALN